MRRRAISLVSVVLATFAVATAAAAEPPELPRVETVADLERCEPMDAGDGWRVRLGYGEPGEGAGGSWLVLYCLAEYTGDAEYPVVRSEYRGVEPLGPVSYTWERVEPRQERALSRQKMLSQASRQRLLYCATLPADDEGAMRLDVFADGDRKLAGRTFDPPKHTRSCYWHTFATRWPGGNTINTKEKTVAGDRADAAYPEFGTVALPVPDRATAEGDAAGAAPRPAPGLPGLGAAGDPDGLRLSLKDGHFVVASEALLRDWPEEHLLARWWVNGEPVVARVSDGSLEQHMSRHVARAKELRVGFGLPDHLPALKAGDKLALQILYSPGGLERFQPAGRQQQQLAQHLVQFEDPGRPLLSNRLEFELTEELLRHADHKPAGQ